MSISNSFPDLPIVEDSRLIFKESLVNIKKDVLRFNNRSYPYYSLITRPFSVIVLATTPDDRYVLIEEYRHPTGKVVLSCPGGFIDNDESPLESARRELLEETGFDAPRFACLGSAYPYAGFTGQKIFYVRAWNAVKTKEPQLERSEVIKPLLTTKEELDVLIGQKKELDANLCAALFFASRELKHP